MGVSGMRGVLAPSGKFSAGAEVVVEEAMMRAEAGKKMSKPICRFFDGDRIR